MNTIKWLKHTSLAPHVHVNFNGLPVRAPASGLMVLNNLPLVLENLLVVNRCFSPDDLLAQQWTWTKICPTSNNLFFWLQSLVWEIASFLKDTSRARQVAKLPLRCYLTIRYLLYQIVRLLFFFSFLKKIS
jgi:hypothetical protein